MRFLSYTVLCLFLPIVVSSRPSNNLAPRYPDDRNIFGIWDQPNGFEVRPWPLDTSNSVSIYATSRSDTIGRSALFRFISQCDATEFLVITDEFLYRISITYDGMKEASHNNERRSRIKYRIISDDSNSVSLLSEIKNLHSKPNTLYFLHYYPTLRSPADSDWFYRQAEEFKSLVWNIIEENTVVSGPMQDIQYKALNKTTIEEVENDRSISDSPEVRHSQLARWYTAVAFAAEDELKFNVYVGAKRSSGPVFEWPPPYC